MKKALSAVLAVVLLFCCSLPAFAQTANAPAAQTVYPIVIARGMNFNGIYTNYGTPAQRLCFHGLSFGGIMKTLGKTMVNSFTMGLRHGFAVAAVDYVQEILGDMACDENGDSVLEVGCDRYYGSMARFPDFLAGVSDDENKEDALARTAAETVGAENVYYYTYDFRLDPYDLADELKSWIDLAKAEHGTDKVILVNCSMAGVITDCYLYKYGAADLAKVLFLSSTFCGTDEADQILRGQVETSDEMLYNYLCGLLGDGLIAKSLYRGGLLRAVAALFNDFAAHELDYVFDAFLRETFGTMLSFWANVQPENVDEAIGVVFPTQELRASHAKLIEKIYRLRDIMAQRETMLSSLPEKGVAVAVVAGYNNSDVPLYPAARMQADGILDARWMLGGAEVSALGGSLDRAGAYVSPDGCVDLTDVLFPDYTWAIRNAGHVPVKYGSDCSNFIMQILLFDGQPDVGCFPEYPQFFTVDAKTKNIVTEKAGRPVC